MLFTQYKPLLDKLNMSRPTIYIIYIYQYSRSYQLKYNWFEVLIQNGQWLDLEKLYYPISIKKNYVLGSPINRTIILTNYVQIYLLNFHFNASFYNYIIIIYLYILYFVSFIYFFLYFNSHSMLLQTIFG